MRKTKSDLEKRITKSAWTLAGIYLAIIAFIAAFWVGVIWLVVNIVKWAWGA